MRLKRLKTFAHVLLSVPLGLIAALVYFSIRYVAFGQAMSDHQGVSTMIVGAWAILCVFVWMLIQDFC